ncbi:MAG: zinc ABC transporter substrate-binding protein [Verrucomicrobia bacterium]|nr:zinc ABC transporter substrate-binding protein [Verrucomicrobiota bacterium]
MKTRRFLLLFSALLIAGSPLLSSAATQKLKVTTTTSMVTDLVKSIGGDRVDVQGLMGPGVDPHLYKASQADVNKLIQAKVIFYNGLLLEGKMQELFNKMSRTRKVYALADALPKARLLSPPEFEGHHDPHIWFDVQIWAMCIDVVVKGLSQADPEGKAYYEKRGNDLRKQMEELHQWALKKVSELPPAKRILITSHDAFNYFGRAYGFQVVGLQGISTVTEVSIADMAKMADFIKAKKVKAIFVESSVPHNTIERVSKDAGVKVGGEIFSDAMGTPGEMENGYDLGTYEGMVKHNVNTIVNALK